jgi:hypothetical protein
MTKILPLKGQRRKLKSSEERRTELLADQVNDLAEEVRRLRGVVVRLLKLLKVSEKGE